MSAFTKHRHLLRPILVYTGVLLLAVIALDPSVRTALFSHTRSAGAAGGYSAVDGLGQLDVSDLPIYTASASNNAPSNRRFARNTDNATGVSDMVIDPVGHRLFVTDGANNRVLMFLLSSSNTIENRVADAVLGQMNSRTNAPATTQNGMRAPQGLAFDATRQWLYVADTGNNRVLVFDVSGGVTSGMNAYRVLGQSIFTTGSFGGTAADSLSSPTDMAVDETGNRLFVGDPGSYRVVVYDVAAITNGEGAVNVLGQINLTAEASGVTDATVVGEPTGIAYDSAAQRLFVTDYANSRVMVFDATGISDGEAAVHVIGQLLMTDSTANWDCPACSRSIYGGRGLAYDASHTRLFVSDNAIADTGSTNNRILVFDVNPGTLTDGPTAINIIGSSSYGISSGGAPSTAQNRLDTSHGLFYEPSTDHLFVADFANDRVMVFDADPAVLTPDVSPGVAEPGNDGPNAIDSLGFLDGADAPLYGSVISETSPNAQGFNVPEGMTMDESNHRLYVSDTGNNRVLVFNLNSSNRLVDYTADYVLGQGNFVTRTTGNTATTMNAPRGLAVNGAGTKLFVADALNNRVLVFDTTLLSSGMAASNVLGQSGFGLAATGTGLSEMATPDDVSYDAVHERLFVADSDNDRVLSFELAGGISDGMAATHRVGSNDKWTAIDVGTLAVPTVSMTRMAVDSTNGVAYAASTVGILRCALSSGCNEIADFTLASASASTLRDVVYDAGHQRLYSGDDRGRIYTCLISSGCDAATDWSGARSTSSSGVKSLAYDATANVLYAGTDQGGTGAIWRCDASSDCSNSSNWNSVLTPAGVIRSISIDTVNQVVYAAGSNGQVYRCEVSISGCIDGPDWIASGIDSGTNLTSTVFDASSHRLYVIDDAGNIMWCNDSDVPCEDTRVDVGTIAAAGGPGWITLDTSRGILFATAGDGVYRCDTATACAGSAGDSLWQLAYATPSAATGLVFEAGTADALFVGRSDLMVHCSGATGCGQNITVFVAAGVTYDAVNDRIFVADEGNNRVLVYDVSSINDNQNPDYVLGQADFTNTTAATTASRLDLAEPCMEGCTNLHMGFNEAGQVLYVPDQLNNRVMVFDVNTITNGEDAVDVIGQADFVSGGGALSATRLDVPQATLVEQGSGRIWVVDKLNNRVMVFEQGYSAPPGAPPHTATDAGGQLDESLAPLFTKNGQDNSPNNRGFNDPEGGIVDTIRHLMFVVDTLNNRVLVYQLDETNAMVDRLADYVIGQQDFRTSTYGTTSTTFNQPRDIAVDEVRALLFVTDYNNNRVMVFNIATITNGMAATAVLGQTKFNRSVNGVSAIKLTNPQGIAFDATTGAERLFVADRGNWRVVAYDVSDGITTNEPAVAVLGQTDLNTRDAGISPTQTSLDEPMSVAYAPDSKQLFVSQREGNRISVFNLSDGLTNNEPAVHVLGQAGYTETSNWTRAASFIGDGAGYVWASAIDTTNQVLYITTWAQSLSGAGVWKCNLASGCDARGDFTRALDTGSYAVSSLAYDAANGVMYAGGLQYVYRCVVATGCDAPGEWVTIHDHAGLAGQAMLSIYNGILYETYSSTAYRCDIAATDCNAEGDWAYLNKSADYITYNPATHVLYAAHGGGGGGGGSVASCDATVPSDCATPANWTIGFNSSYYNLSALYFDTTTNALYLGADTGLGVTDAILRCGLETGCDADADWHIVLDQGIDQAQAFATDAERGVLYAGTFLGDILMCPTASGCNQSSDWSLAYNMVGSYINSITVDAANDLVFAGGDAGTATAFRCDALAGCGPMEMYEANDMVVSSDETYLYVADTFYDRVLVYNIASITDGEAPVNVIGQQTLSDYGYGTSDTELFGPSGVWLGNGTSLYVSDSDNNRVMSFSISPLTDGISAEDAVGQLTPTDQPIFTVNGENDSPNALGYKQPAGVAVDTAGHRLFVADTVNNRVLMYNLTTHNQFDDHVADAVLGQPDFKARTAATTADGMSAPKQLAYDTARNRLFVADSGNNRVLAFDVASITDGESATMVFGQGADVASAPNFTTATTAPVSAHSLNAPSGVAVDSTNGALFISDTLNNRVLAYDFNAGNGSFANGDADRVFGQSGNFSLNASASDANGFYQPSGVFVDAAGDAFWVADTLNNRVLKRPLAADSVDPATVVLGQADFTTATAGTTERKMSEPTAVAKDDNTGDLYVADTENNRVLSFTTTDGVDSGEAATAVYGQASFGTAAPDVTAETVSGPRAIAYDPTRGTLWAADAANNRVLYFGPLDEVLVTGPGGGTEPIGFYPLRIVINDDDTTTDSRNVLVNVFAQYNANFSGTVDVLLSNTPDFATTIPFRYTIPRRTVFTAWNKTMAWDLCFGLPSTTPCDPGKKIVYARFYVNLPTVWPILTPFTTARTTP